MPLKISTVSIENRQENRQRRRNIICMWKYAICNETFGNLEWAETCAQIASFGYDGVELAPFTLASDVRDISSQQRQAYRQTAQRDGLEIVGLHWLLVSPSGLSLTSPDDGVRAHTATYLASLVDFCADMGGKILVLGSPKQRRIPMGENIDTAIVRLQSALEPALERAAIHNLTLCLEPLPPPEADLILTLEDAVNVVERLQHPNLQTILDIKSASSEQASIPELARKFRSHIAHVHANDANRRGPGFGATDFIPVLHALHEIQYTGYVSVEVFDYTPDPITIARDSLTYLRQCQQKASGSV